MESLSRCYACLDERENALNLVEDLVCLILDSICLYKQSFFAKVGLLKKTYLYMYGKFSLSYSQLLFLEVQGTH